MDESRRQIIRFKNVCHWLLIKLTIYVFTYLEASPITNAERQRNFRENQKRKKFELRLKQITQKRMHGIKRRKIQTIDR